MMRRLHLSAPQLIGLLVAATALLSLWGTAAWLVRAGLVALLLVLPGVALTAALFGGGRLDATGCPDGAGRLDGAERLLYVLIAGVAAVALTGLLLNITPWGLDRLAWAALLVLVTAVAGLVAWRRKPRASKGAPVAPPAVEPLNLAQVSLFGMSAVMLGLALAVARVPAPAAGHAGYSLLWVLPAEESAAQDQPAPVWEIGVDSSEFAPATYSVAVSLGDQIVYLSPGFTLAPHERWQTEVDLSPYAGSDGPLEARLYRSGAPGVVYRHVLVREPLRLEGSENQ